MFEYNNIMFSIDMALTIFAMNKFDDCHCARGSPTVSDVMFCLQSYNCKQNITSLSLLVGMTVVEASTKCFIKAWTQWKVQF